MVTDPDFLRHYGIPFATAEGFLMPDTYLLKKTDEPDDAQFKAQARAVAGPHGGQFLAQNRRRLARQGPGPSPTISKNG